MEGMNREAKAMVRSRIVARVVLGTLTVVALALVVVAGLGSMQETAAKKDSGGIMARLDAIEARLDELQALVLASGDQIMFGQGVAAKKQGLQYNCRCETNALCPHGNHYVCGADLGRAQAACNILCPELNCGTGVATLAQPEVDCADVAEAISGEQP
jgi:hypothetical protein